MLGGGALVDRERLLLAAGTQSLANPLPMHRRHACFPGEYWQPCFLLLQRVQAPGFSPAPEICCIVVSSTKENINFTFVHCHRIGLRPEDVDVQVQGLTSCTCWITTYKQINH